MLILSFSIDHRRLLEDTEGLLASPDVLGGLVGDDVEADSLGEGAALTDGHNITLLDGIKGGGAVGGNVLVALLKTTVLGDVVKVVPADDNGVLHLGREDDALEDASTNGDVSGERALLVDVVSLNGGVGSLDAKAYGTNEAHGLVLLGADGTLASDENSILGLVGVLVLIALFVHGGETGRHGYLWCKT